VLLLEGEWNDKKGEGRGKAALRSELQNWNFRFRKTARPKSFWLGQVSEFRNLENARSKQRSKQASLQARTPFLFFLLN
jgi:hypothetical protein